jgi:hypothetical protein
MPKPTSRRATHPKGELESALGTPGEDTKLDTFGGRVEVLWDPKAEVTALGPLVYFIQFLKTSWLWERWVEECPLAYSSNNTPPTRPVSSVVVSSRSYPATNTTPISTPSGACRSRKMALRENL